MNIKAPCTTSWPAGTGATASLPHPPEPMLRVFFGHPWRVLRAHKISHLGVGSYGQSLKPPTQDALGRCTSLRRSWIWKKVRLRSGDNVSAQVRKPSRTIQQRTYAGSPDMDKDAPRRMSKIGNRSLTPFFLTCLSLFPHSVTRAQPTRSSPPSRDRIQPQ